MATTTHDEGFHEIQLNGKQLVFLFMAGTVVAVVIFLLGVFVGRGVRAQQIAGVEPGVDEAVATKPSEPDLAPSASSSTTPAPADTDYTKRLLDESAPKETLTRAPSAAAPSAAAPSAAAASAPASSATASSAPAPSTLSASGAPATPGARSASSTAVPSEPAGEGFSIQLAALAKREEAEGIVRRLSGKGYAAYLIAPASGAPVYRVRVGKFKDRREAESVSSRLQKEEQFKPWIVR